MIEVKALKKGDFAKLNPHHTQAQHEATEEYETQLMRGDRAFALWIGDTIIASFGYMEIWQGRRLIWAVMGVETSKHMRELTAIAKRMLKQYYYRRSEIYVDATFPQGFRWAKMLGFTLETPEPMKGFFPQGGDAYLFSLQGD